MKRIIISVLLVVVMIVCLAACGTSTENGASQTNNNKEEAVIPTTENTNESKGTISDEVSASKVAADYLPTCTKMRELLTKYYSEKGIDFNNWIQSGAQNNILRDPYGSGAIFVESNGCLNFFVESQREFVVYHPDNSISDTIFIIRSWSYDVYEMLSYLISDIPNELKPTIRNLKSSTDSITTGYSEPISVGGLQYQIGINGGKAVEIIITRK